VVRARVLSTRGHIRVLIGDFANGSADAATAAELADAFGDPAAGGRAHGTLHRALIFSGDSAAAQRAADAAAACLASTGDVLARAQLGAVDAMFCLQAGEPRRCCEVAARALGLLPDDEIWCSAHLLGLQAMGLFLCGDLAAAQRPAHRSLAMKSELQDVTGTAFGLCGLAFLAAGAGRATRTAWLFGAAAPLWERVGRWYTSSPAFERLHQVAERAARASLGDDGYWQTYAAGTAAPPGHAVERALSDADELAAD
jgi:non-specific serine/threonine protein kinase